MRGHREAIALRTIKRTGGPESVDDDFGRSLTVDMGRRYGCRSTLIVKKNKQHENVNLVCKR